MSAGITGGLGSGLTERIVQQLPAFTGDVGGALYGAAKAVELARDIVQRRLELPAELPALLREKQVASGAADHCAHNGCDNSSILSIFHGAPPAPSTAVGRMIATPATH